MKVLRGVYIYELNRYSTRVKSSSGISFPAVNGTMRDRLLS